jgi:hypothetical protein
MTAVRFIDAERVRALRREAGRLAARDEPARRRPGKPVSKIRTLAVVAGATLATVACVVLSPRAHAAAPGPATPAALRAPVPDAVSAPAAPSSGPQAAPRYALVLQDATSLRGGPKAAGAPLAQLGQGELLELRGARIDYVQVWDPARERGGFVRASAVRPLALTPGEAPELLALVQFLRDRPGSEALGLGFAAAYLKAAPAGTIGADVFDAMGTMAERLAWRANAAAAGPAAARPGEPSVAAQLEVAGALGVRFDAVERDGASALCYDGDAFRHVLALSPTPEQAARAALALTRHDCIATTLPPLERWQLDRARAALLDRVPPAALPGYVRDRIRMRQAGVEAAIAFEDSRRLAVEAGRGAEAAGLPAVSAVDVQRAGQAALEALAAVDKSELADDDQSTYADAAMRVGAARWAAEPVVAPPAAGLRVVTRAGQPGETCVLLVDGRHDAARPLAQRCTFATVWTASARASAHADALALAVQPLEGWRELWMFRAAPDGWTVQVLPPSAQGPGIGYVEFAGWVPGTGEVLAAREVRDPQHAARTLRTYELLDGRTLETERAADAPGSLTPFYRWQDPAWRRVTVSLR